ncbi:MAG: FkbM family methyltransferase [Candidatus Aenigmarchaeota archaeon]|nr:FkbM family methyltransferase [Candidatus Aenigmarchaeota archaeon]
MEIRAKLIYNENVNLIEKIYYSLFKYIFSLCMLYKYILNFLKLNYGKYTGVIYHISNLYLFFVDYKKIFFKIKINNISFFMKTISLKNFSIMLIEDIEGYFLYNDIKKGDIVIDAGAYIGLFTLYASKKVGKNGLVIAYEPDPENYKNLLENIKLNKCKNVKLIKEVYLVKMIFYIFKKTTDLRHLFLIKIK